MTLIVESWVGSVDSGELGRACGQWRVGRVCGLWISACVAMH